MKKIFTIMYEVDDKGWLSGHHAFEKVEDAVQHMRDYVANFIMYRRAEGKKVTRLFVWRDRVMNCASVTDSQTISFMVDGVPYEFRVWSLNLHSEKLNKAICL